MSEILEHIYYEIKNSGFEKKLIGGIVVTGGGSQLAYEPIDDYYWYGLWGWLSKRAFKFNTNINVTSPLFATGVGLVAKGFEKFELLKSKK